MNTFSIERIKTEKNQIRESLIFQPVKDFVYAAKRRLDVFIEEHKKDPFLIKYLSKPAENKIIIVIQPKTNKNSFFSNFIGLSSQGDKQKLTLEQERDILVAYLTKELKDYEALYEKTQNAQTLRL